jgi:hypothetical protein
MKDAKFFLIHTCICIHTYIHVYTQVGNVKDTKFCLMHANGDTVKLRADKAHDADVWVQRLTTAARKVCLCVYVYVSVCMYVHIYEVPRRQNT